MHSPVNYNVYHITTGHKHFKSIEILRSVILSLSMEIRNIMLGFEVSSLIVFLLNACLDSLLTWMRKQRGRIHLICLFKLFLCVIVLSFSSFFIIINSHRHMPWKALSSLKKTKKYLVKLPWEALSPVVKWVFMVISKTVMQDWEFGVKGGKMHTPYLIDVVRAYEAEITKISTTFPNTEVNNCFSIYHTSWIITS